ncbi:VacJ family lipoprotein [Bisgaard Taxon 10/6]|uniref:MlaA family lipoprotein n=1 Tax=Exercitatus varius TaxID=67857 RepID=UPI00294B0DF7|nr:VacJ family lipoprotein [Exercitatus varius]MDG2947267.1 VacJ family lipoprotein [Exercitatus varius]MDG2956062.1 VacJ family lipoprotein [Exercitatus varius]MDG2958359.1 VacJ family lipoprotein [Exercitatus varius]MDG2965195.1 VacJ family lipoprotein [Exercitatus varius]
MKKISLFLTALFSAVALAGCSNTLDPVTGERSDPLQGFNRTMWDFNYKVLDPYLLKPAAKGWNALPDPLTTGLSNAANNLDEPVSFLNRLWEGEGQKAMVHLNRFIINSTFGLGGLIDWASYSDPLKIEHQRNFGDTLGSYGVNPGTYIVLPVYNATTPRELTGALVDNAYTYPFWHWVGGAWSLVKYGVQEVDTRAKAMNTNAEALLEQSADPYITFREAYYQNLEYRATDGNVKAKETGLSEEDLNSID